MGDFEKALLRTKEAEAAVKYYKAGDSEPWHVHRIATEITVVVEGMAEFWVGPKTGFRERVLVREGEMLMLEPGEGTLFNALEDTVTVVFKSPSCPGDKYTE